VTDVDRENMFQDMIRYASALASIHRAGDIDLDVWMLLAQICNQAEIPYPQIPPVLVATLVATTRLLVPDAKLEWVGATRQAPYINWPPTLPTTGAAEAETIINVRGLLGMKHSQALVVDAWTWPLDAFTCNQPLDTAGPVAVEITCRWLGADRDTARRVVDRAAQDEEFAAALVALTDAHLEPAAVARWIANHCGDTTP